MRRRSFLLAAGLLLTAGLVPARAADPIPVVASFSILGDLVSEVGGERVSVTTLVGPNGDAHVFQPSPSDAARLAKARVVVLNGLSFEGWIDRLIESAGYAGPVVIASEGVEALTFAEDEAEHGHHDDHHDGHVEKPAVQTDHDHDHDHDHGHDHGTTDPHAWQSVANVEIYVRNIAAGLTAADPEGAAIYAENAAAYIAELKTLDAQMRASLARIPENRREVISSHDAFGYFTAAYGITFVAPQGVNTESEASAADVAKIVEQIREKSIPAVFVESISDKRLLKQIADETGAAIGDDLYSDALSGPDGPAPTYVAMMRHNVQALVAALADPS